MNTLFKKLLYYDTRLSQVLGHHIFRYRKSERPRMVVFYPEFDSKEFLADQVNRARWYIPKSAGATIWMGVDKSLSSINIAALPVPKHQREPKSPESDPEIILCNSHEMSKQLKKADVICIWNTKAKHWLKHVLRHPFRVRIVDPNFYRYTESHTNAALLWYDLYSKQQRKEAKEQSQQNFKKLFEQYKASGKAYIFGTGPSIEIANKHVFDDGVRIICNTIIANDQLLDRIKPNVLTFVDPVFHFGVSLYCDKFAQDIIKVVKKYGIYIVTNEVGYALMRTHYPELQDNLIGVPPARFGKPTTLTPESFTARDYPYSVVTRLMLPLAAGLSKNIVMTGFDGRDPNDDYFWKHNSATQYNDNMKDVWNTHKAFFDDTDFANHHKGHCAVLTKMIEAFECDSIKVKVLGHSYVPVLKKRIIDK